MIGGMPLRRVSEIELRFMAESEARSDLADALSPVFVNGEFNTVRDGALDDALWMRSN